ncbi:hypothetical protein LWI28_029018 [Acer negundo]|uniref:Leucine-rich repeat-containing N-terminal plant-type domain-containing protein n=1 Tax=Acer negundo TaxID=4023 RepID=A0AAD5IER1_ACENE|nr:hypothetical protein LWI28_029018 [Acer negundo]
MRSSNQKTAADFQFAPQFGKEKVLNRGDTAETHGSAMVIYRTQQKTYADFQFTPQFDKEEVLNIGDAVETHGSAMVIWHAQHKTDTEYQLAPQFDKEEFLNSGEAAEEHGSTIMICRTFLTPRVEESDWFLTCVDIGISNYVVDLLVMNLLHMPKIYSLIAVHLALGFIVLSTLRFFRIQVRNKFGHQVEAFFVILTVLQFHLFYCMRPLPNILALAVVILLVPFVSSITTFTTRNLAHNQTDEVELRAFKSKITRDPQGVLDSWNDYSHFCEWEGITCGRMHRRVTVLNLTSKGLSGSLSPYIGNLSFLRV